MNEELKIIISAVTTNAQKNIKQVNKQLQGIGTTSNKASGVLKGAMGKMAKTAAIAGAAIAGALAGVGAALVKLEKSTRDFRTEQAKLQSAFAASGAGAKTAEKTYMGLFRFLGESDTAVEAAAHLAKLTTSEQNLAEWTKACQGIYATFGDSLPIEGLTEAANETARVGKVTGVLADALNWAGSNEDQFNSQLQSYNTLAERETLIRQTLSGLYNDAAEAYERNNQALIRHNESQARLDYQLAKIGKIITPVITAFNNLAATLLGALEPVIMRVGSALAWLTGKLEQAINWISGFIKALGGGGGKSSAATVRATAVSAGNIATGFNNAAKAAEKFKRTTAGFDELNKVGANPTPAGGGGGGAGGGGGIIDTPAPGDIPVEIIPDSTKFEEFINRIKTKVEELKTVFEPTISAWGESFNTLNEAWNNSKGNIDSGIEHIKNGFSGIVTYMLEEFIPNMTNSWSENLLPVWTDVAASILENGSYAFDQIGNIWEDAVNSVFIPLLGTLETVYTDTFKAIKDAWDKYGGQIREAFSKVVKFFIEKIKFYYDRIKTRVQEIKKKLQELWDEHLEPLVRRITNAIGSIVSNLLILYSEFQRITLNIKRVLQPILDAVFDFIVEKAGNMLATISEVIGGVIRTIQGLVEFVTGVFTGDWKKAWEGIKNIFGGVWESLAALLKSPINSIIININAALRAVTSAVNFAIRAINKIHFTVPDWVPVIGGNNYGFNISQMTAPQIPQLAKGGIITKSTVINAGEAGKEAILPLENNLGWMDKFINRLSERDNKPTKIVLTIDGKELGEATINSINNITKQTGQLQLALV